MINNMICEKLDCIRFEFYDSTTGNNLRSVICKGVFLFKYSSSLLTEENEFPYFVLDVTKEAVNKKDFIKHLERNRFSFYQSIGLHAISESNSYSIFRIQGGEIDVFFGEVFGLEGYRERDFWEKVWYVFNPARAARDGGLAALLQSVISGPVGSPEPEAQAGANELVPAEAGARAGGKRSCAGRRCSAGGG
jgi:hypothetical protein